MSSRAKELRGAQMKRQMTPKTNGLLLGQRAERGDDLQFEIQCVACRYRKVTKELCCRVAKRIVAERADGNGPNALARAEDRRLRKQQQVATGQVDGFVLAEQLSGPTLELEDGRVLAFLLVAHLGRGHRRAHVLRGLRRRIGAEIDHAENLAAVM